MITTEITEFVILSLLALSGYIVGLITTISIIKRLNDKIEREESSRLYKERIEEYEKMINEMMLRLNIIELRLRNKHISHGVSHITYHIPKEKPVENEDRGKIDNIEYKVLNLLIKGAKTSREIEVNIGRSREHTARLMKKLYEKGYVIRDIRNKPYKYSITDLGKSILNQVEVA